jgi:hypothetical protein
MKNGGIIGMSFVTIGTTAVLNHYQMVCRAACGMFAPANSNG